MSNTFNVIQQNTLAALSNTNSTKKENEFLTPEQKNILVDDFNAKISEQADNIKSNFQTAKDIDLTRAYFEQQQKLVDIYMQSGSKSNSSDNSNTSATKVLTEAYASLYQLHQTVKGGSQQLPSVTDKTLPSSSRPETQSVIQPEIKTQTSAQKQTDTYNSFMMPTTNSYLRLNA